MPSTESISSLLETVLAQKSANVESDILEFKGYPHEKALLDKLEDVVREIVAFANTDGGYLVFGVQDKPDSATTCL